MDSCCGSRALCTLDDSDTEGNQHRFFKATRVWKIACKDQVRSGTRCEEPTVARNNMLVVENGSIFKSTKSGLDFSSYGPTDFKFAEYFGGGSEYFSFLRPPLWPFSFIRLFGQEEE